MPRSGRPSTANAEYSSAINPASGWRTCLAASPYELRTSLSRHIASNSGLSRQTSSTSALTVRAAPARAASARNAATTNRASLSQFGIAAHLYRLVLEQGTAGARYHGVAEEGVAFRD